jgi:putative cell wall-binding protein
MVLAVVPAFGAGETLDRIAGADRWATAVEVSQKGWDNASIVVLANGRNYPDALAGVPLAHALGGPILLTEANELVAATKAEIIRLGAAKVVLLGGTGVISAKVADELTGMGLAVERLSGDDRFETAAAIAAKVAPTGVDTVVLASGRGFADALAVASYAAVEGYPILLTEKNSLPAATKKAIEDLGATHVIVVGGTGVIADSAVAGLPGVKRVSGSNREATSVALAKHFEPQTNKFFLATGDGFADAITGAVLAAQEGTGILLVRKSFPAVVGDFFASAEVIEAVIFGGTGVVSASIASAAAAKLVPAMGTGVAGITTPSAIVTVGKASVTADKTSGAYQITGLAPGEHTVTLSMDGYAPVSKTVKVYKDNISVADFVLGSALDQSAINIPGAVVDSVKQTPLDGVKAEAYYWDTDKADWVDSGLSHTTGANGTFSVPNTGSVLDFGDKVLLVLSKDNYHEVEIILTLKVDGVANPVAGSYLVPIKKMEITGKVTEAGVDVPSASVQLQTAKGVDIGSPVVTDTEGKYKIADQYLLSGSYVIKVSKSGYANTVTTVSVSEGVNLVHNAALVTGYNLTYNVDTDTPGGKYADGDYEAALYKGGVKYAEGTLTAPTYPTTTLEFKWINKLVAPGSYTLRVTGDHLLQTDFPVTIVKEDVVDWGSAAFTGCIKGTVTAGAKVELLNKDGAVIATQDLAATATAYKFRNLGAGKYRVRVSKAGFQTAVNPIATADPAALTVNTSLKLDVTLTADPDKGINGGTVYTAGSLAPIEDATVTYYYKNVINPGTKEPYKAGDIAIAATTTAAGLYTTGNLDPGTYTVVIRAAGRETQAIERAVAAGDNYTTLNYFLQTGSDASLTLEVNDKDKAAVTSGITLEDAWGKAYTGAVYDTTKFRFASLPAGTYDLAIVYAGHVTVETTVVIGRSAVVTRAYNLVATPTKYTVNLGLRGADNIPVSTARIAAINAAGKTVDTGSTDASGLATLSLPDGVYKITFSKDGYRVAQVTVTINKPTAPISVPWVTILKW